MKYTYIQRQGDFTAYLRKLQERKNAVIAVDLEAELNRHAYGETLCLLQIFDGEETLLVDPFNIETKVIRAFFEDAGSLKVIYDGSSDLSLLRNTYDTGVAGLLDLRPAVELLGYEKADLHSVIAAELGIVLSQKSKYQKHNWMRRPIDRRAIEYALNDVLHLLRLKDALLKKLCERGLLDIYILKNLQVQGRDYRRNPEDRYRRMKGFSQLTREEKKLLEKVYDVRDRYAQQFNMPPHNIVHNSVLVKMVRDPAEIAALTFPRRLGEKVGQEIVAELRQALSEKVIRD